MKELIYTTSSCDQHSLDQLKVMLYTLKKNGGSWPITLGLVNPKSGIGTKLRNINPDIVSIEAIEIEDTGEMVKRKTEKIPRFNVDVMYTRPLGIQKMLKKDVQKLLSIDTDIIIRGSLSPLWDGVSPGTIKVWDRGPTKKDWVRFQGGVVLYGNSEATRKYYDSVMEAISNDKEFYTYQGALFQLWQRSCVRKIELKKRYNDTDFDNRSIIWHCKHSHFNDPKYQNEFRYYLKKANKKYESI